MHPKTEIRPDPASIRKVLEAGWIGQRKIHGHRTQIHLSSDLKAPLLAYNRQGQLHKKAVSPAIEAELRRLFQPKNGWTAIDAEWIKPKDKLYLFDLLKRDGVDLGYLGYGERWTLLPRDYLSPFLITLPLLHTVEKCLESLQKDDEDIEGLVFKSLTAVGFSDTAIVRCRKRMSVTR
jgi:hypothetical protein